MNTLRQLRRFWQLNEPNWVVIILITNLVFFALSLLLSQTWNQGRDVPSSEALYLLGSNQAHLILDGQWYRLIVANFLHGGLLHILCNSYFLWQLGPYAQVVLGGRRFLSLYLFTGLTGAALSMGWRLFQHSGTAPWLLQGAIGASTSMFGILGFLLFWAKRTPGTEAFGNQLVFCLLVNLGLGFSIPVIDNAGHIGGLIGGFLFAFSFVARRPNPFFRGLLSATFTRVLALLVLVSFAAVPIQYFGEFGTTCRRLYTIRPYVGDALEIFDTEGAELKEAVQEVAEYHEEWGDELPVDLAPLHDRLKSMLEKRGENGWAVDLKTLAAERAWNRFLLEYFQYLGRTGRIRVQR